MITVVIAACVAIGAAGPARAQPSVRSARASRCAALTDLASVTAAVIDGDQALAKARAHSLRKLAAGDAVPRKVKSALGRLAHFFEEAHNQSIAERTATVVRLTVPITVIARYSAQVCPGVATTTTSSLPG
jgi:hypothetical protein